MPGLRENIKAKLSTGLIIDPDFSKLIPPLTPDEFAGLERSILSEGCRDALIVWNNIIVDGHNRFKICEAHDIPYKIEHKEFADRNSVILWMLQNQLARRNLSDFQRVEIVRKCEQAVKAQAKARQGTRTDLQTSGQNFPDIGDNIVPKSAPSRSRDVLANMAGVGHSTYEHAAAVLDKAPEEVVQATRRNEISINAAYNVTKLPKELQADIATRIQQGENPKTVIASVKSQKAEAALDDCQAELELLENQVYSTELLNLELTRTLIQNNCSQDCILLLWVKPEDLTLAFSSIFGQGPEAFEYIKIVFVWTCASNVKELCLFGKRGKVKIPKGLLSKVIDAQAEGKGQRPKLFDDFISELMNKCRK